MRGTEELKTKNSKEGERVEVSGKTKLGDFQNHQRVERGGAGSLWEGYREKLPKKF